MKLSSERIVATLLSFSPACASTTETAHSELQTPPGVIQSSQEKQLTLDELYEQCLVDLKEAGPVEEINECDAQANTLRMVAGGSIRLLQIQLRTTLKGLLTHNLAKLKGPDCNKLVAAALEEISPSREDAYYRDCETALPLLKRYDEWHSKKAESRKRVAGMRTEIQNKAADCR